MDARALQAIKLHKSVERDKQKANEHRAERDKLILELRTEDPAYWSYGRLARTIGCSKSRIRGILGPSADTRETVEQGER